MLHQKKGRGNNALHTETSVVCCAIGRLIHKNGIAFARLKVFGYDEGCTCAGGLWDEANKSRQCTHQPKLKSFVLLLVRTMTHHHNLSLIHRRFTNISVRI
jgi:hypothetical protein